MDIKRLKKNSRLKRLPELQSGATILSDHPAAQVRTPDLRGNQGNTKFRSNILLYI
jgi:hypothetical protein